MRACCGSPTPTSIAGSRRGAHRLSTGERLADLEPGPRLARDADQRWRIEDVCAAGDTGLALAGRVVAGSTGFGDGRLARRRDRPHLDEDLAREIEPRPVEVERVVLERRSSHALQAAHAEDPSEVGPIRVGIRRRGRVYGGASP